LVRAQLACDGRMNGKIRFESSQIPNIVYSLLKTSYVARCETDPAYTETFELAGNVNMFCMRRRGLGFINGNLQLAVPASRKSDQMPVHRRYVSYRPSILDGRPQQPVLVKTDCVTFRVDSLAQITGGKRSGIVLKFFPGQPVYGSAKFAQ